MDVRLLVVLLGFLFLIHSTTATPDAADTPIETYSFQVQAAGQQYSMEIIGKNPATSRGEFHVPVRILPVKLLLSPLTVAIGTTTALSLLTNSAYFVEHDWPGQPHTQYMEAILRSQWPRNSGYHVKLGTLNSSSDKFGFYTLDPIQVVVPRSSWQGVYSNGELVSARIEHHFWSSTVLTLGTSFCKFHKNALNVIAIGSTVYHTNGSIESTSGYYSQGGLIFGWASYVSPDLLQYAPNQPGWSSLTFAFSAMLNNPRAKNSVPPFQTTNGLNNTCASQWWPAFPTAHLGAPAYLVPGTTNEYVQNVALLPWFLQEDPIQHTTYDNAYSYPNTTIFKSPAQPCVNS